ncbi:MAG: hypothetical protein OES84_02985, partial [Kiritimatiellaceae bacterium]|nr:hypothetical protein [Kiritimatiellaceae bacterium]
MKKTIKWLVTSVLFANGAAIAANTPHIGYAFPAGGQQGQTFDVEIGGQYLLASTNVFVSGEGVKVKILSSGVRYEPRVVGQLFRRIENAKASMKGKDGKEREKFQKQIDRATKKLQQADLPEGIDPLDKRAVQRYFRVDKKEQFNPQLSDRLQVRVTIDKKAPAGERELRVYTPAGLSNPICFQVGTLAETR